MDKRFVEQLPRGVRGPASHRGAIGLSHDGRPMTATLVYLHRIGAEHDDAWRDLMSAALIELGYLGLFDGVGCCAPKYPNTLRYPSDERHDIPQQTSPRISGRERDELHWRVERATADLESFDDERAQPVGASGAEDHRLTITDRGAPSAGSSRWCGSPTSPA